MRILQLQMRQQYVNFIWWCLNDSRRPVDLPAKYSQQSTQLVTKWTDHKIIQNHSYLFLESKNRNVFDMNIELNGICIYL